jgi:hypothetical protein
MKAAIAKMSSQSQMLRPVGRRGGAPRMRRELDALMSSIQPLRFCGFLYSVRAGLPPSSSRRDAANSGPQALCGHGFSCDVAAIRSAGRRDGFRDASSRRSCGTRAVLASNPQMPKSQAPARTAGVGILHSLSDRQRASGGMVASITTSICG